MHIGVKCKNCRRAIITEEECQRKLHNTLFIDSHEDPLNFDDLHKGAEVAPVPTCRMDNVIYLHDSRLPDWIQDKVLESGWTKGRLNCPHCNVRVGAFDFVSGPKCGCQGVTAPAVHLNRNKVDL